MVSWIFLVVACIGGLFTVNAFRPVRHNVVLYVPSFFASWLTIELAWVHIAWQAVFIALFTWAGALDHWAGWVGLAITAVSWVALASVVLAARATSAAADKALAAFGGDPVVPTPRHKVRWIRRVPFRQVGGRTLKIDVALPVDPPPAGQRRPALLQVHGGAWIIGFKRQQAMPLLKEMASHGWVCFDPDYRHSPAATWPDHLVDVKHALAWIREHADEYGVDPRFVAVTGGSAGGHLASLVALTANDPAFQPGLDSVDTSVQAAVPFYAVYDLTNRDDTMPEQFRTWVLEPLVMKRFYAEEPEVYAAASPMDRVHAGAPPFLAVHGDRDTLAPVEDARTFVARLGEVSDAPVLYCELHGAQHAFDTFSSIRTRRTVRAVHRFLAMVYAQYRAGVAPEHMDLLSEAMPDEVVEVEGAEDVQEAIEQADR